MGMQCRWQWRWYSKYKKNHFLIVSHCWDHFHQQKWDEQRDDQVVLFPTCLHWLVICTLATWNDEQFGWHISYSKQSSCKVVQASQDRKSSGMCTLCTAQISNMGMQHIICNMDLQQVIEKNQPIHHLGQSINRLHPLHFLIVWRWRG